MKKGDVIVDRDGDAGRVVSVCENVSLVVDYQMPHRYANQILIGADYVVNIISDLTDEDAKAYIRTINRMR